MNRLKTAGLPTFCFVLLFGNLSFSSTAGQDLVSLANFCNFRHSEVALRERAETAILINDKADCKEESRRAGTLGRLLHQQV